MAAVQVRRPLCGIERSCGWRFFNFGSRDGDHTQVLGDNIRHMIRNCKADKSSHLILISHPAQRARISVYVLLTERKNKKNATTDCSQLSRPQAGDTCELDSEMAELAATSREATGPAAQNGLREMPHSKGQVPRRWTARMRPLHQSGTALQIRTAGSISWSYYHTEQFGTGPDDHTGRRSNGLRL